MIKPVKHRLYAAVENAITRATGDAVSEEVGRVISGALHDAIFDAVTMVTFMRIESAIGRELVRTRLKPPMMRSAGIVMPQSVL